MASWNGKWIRFLFSLAAAFPLAPAPALSQDFVAPVPVERASTLVETASGFNVDVAEPWGSNLFRPDNARMPHDEPLGFPNVFDQPAMSRGPGSCGFTAAANLGLLLATQSVREPWTGITPWKVLELGYNLYWGIDPKTLMSYLDMVFSSSQVPANLQGTTFQWGGAMHYTRLFPESAGTAQARLDSAIRGGRPVIALTKWAGDEAHYVVVAAENAARDAYWVVTWGKYLSIPKLEFMKWWETHPFYRYGSITPSRAALSRF